MLLLLLLLLATAAITEQTGRLVSCAKEVFLLSETNTTGTVTGNERRSFPNMDVFLSWGFRFEAVQRIPCSDLEAVPLGPPMDMKPVPPAPVINQTDVNEKLLVKLREVAGVYKGSYVYLPTYLPRSCHYLLTPCAPLCLQTSAGTKPVSTSRQNACPSTPMCCHGP